MADIGSILAQAEDPANVRTVVARILVRQDLVARHAELDAELTAAIAGDARENRTPVAPQVAAEIEALEAEIEAAKVPFTFRSIGKRAWRDLLAQHPPTKEHRTAGLDHNPETFPLAAIAASCVEPVMLLADVERLERALNATQFDVLWARCVDANVGGGADPKSVAAGLIRRANALSASSATAVDEQSLAASSSAE